MTARPLRVMVVEDSVTVRRRIVEVLGADPAIEVVAEAGDGKTAIEKCQALRPDVMTLDMMLPVMSGLAATEFIMAYCPTPILIVSSSTNRGEVFRTLDALAAGAIDVLEKPTGTELPGEWERQLVATVKLVARIKVISHPRARLANRARAHRAPRIHRARRDACRLIAIGASTGGPAAVRDVLLGLPADFPVPILLVIHVGRPFAMPLADWLDGQSPIRVAHARAGDPIPARGDTARVIMAPPDSHMVVEGGHLRLSDAPERHSCRPSVDVLFESIARENAAGCVACLLTGMGRDGAAGLFAIRQAGGITLAQDEATSVVHGMPREAILLGAADEVLPIGDMPAALMELAGGGAPRTP